MSRLVRSLSAVAISAMTAAAMAVASPYAAAVGQHASTTKPGVIGTPITLASQVSFDGDSRAYSMASDKSGTTYIAWIASSANNPNERALHLCTLPLGATACKGGVQAVPLTDPQTSANIRLLVTPGGAVTIVWYHTDAGGGEIAEATSQAGGPLSAEHDVATAPISGELLDAELAPDGSIWTVAVPESGSPLEVREGFTSPETAIASPVIAGYAQLAFSGSTPIIAIGSGNLLNRPAYFTYLHGGSWTHFAGVPGTATEGSDVGLVSTRSGVRLSTDIENSGDTPVIAKWNGHGFDRAVPTGDTCILGSHDLVTDASGRLVTVSHDACDSIAVSNLAASGHATILRLSQGQTEAGGSPQIATVPRGYAWVAWSTLYGSSSAQGDRLRVEEIRLPGVQTTVTKRGSHGTTVVTGPASCLPAVSLSVGVKGHPKKGWKVTSHTLKLGSKKLGASLNGASLTAGKTYKLKGSVVFAKGKAHSTVTATLSFRSCPNP